MRITTNILAIVFVAAILWWSDYAISQATVGSITFFAVFACEGWISHWITLVTGRSSIRNSRSDAVYFALGMGGILWFQLAYPNADLLTSMIAFAVSLLIGRVAAQLTFGGRDTNEPLSD